LIPVLEISMRRRVLTPAS